MMHSQHPDVHTHGLADGCPECTALAEYPFAALDREMLQQLLGLAVDRERLRKGRSEAELVASAKILTTLEHVGSLCEADAGAVVAYLAERWRIPLTLEGGPA